MTNLPGITPQDRYLWHLAIEGSHTVYKDKPDIMDRIQMEMDVITKNKFTDYILIIWDIHDFCRSPHRVYAFCAMNGITPPPDGIIPIGPGRGSVGGSAVCYAIGIHQCDPLRFGLYFERFLNPERIAYPDIDFDISQRYRHIVLRYVAATYGADRVSQIITFSTLSVKSANEEVLKAAQVPMSTIAMVKQTVPEDPTITMADMEENEKYIKIMQAIVFPDTQIVIDQTNVNKIRTMSNISIEDQAQIKLVAEGKLQNTTVRVKSSWTWEKAIDIIKKLEKLSKHESVHSGGVVVSPRELRSNVPLMRKSGDGVSASQYDMRSLEELGYLKMDALGLRTVDVNHDAGRLVRKWYDPDFDIRKIPYDDQKAIDLIRKGDTVGIFQVESSGFTQMMCSIFKANQMNDQQRDMLEQVEGLQDIEIADFMWVSAGLAMYRPGPLDAIIEGKTMVQHLIDRKAGKEPVMYLFPEEENYLVETYGIMIYQEQVMARVRQMTGCTMGRADVLRKAMGKKNPVLMKEQMDWFRGEAMKTEFTLMPLSPERKSGIISRAVEEIEKFARYGFNKAHTVEYAHICYHNAYYKANYPVAFYTALLNSEMGDSKRQAIIIRDMVAHGIELLPPLVNESEPDFTMTGPETIRFGLMAIKGLGEKGVVHVMADRKAGGEFFSVEDFRARISGSLCNVNVMTNLAKAGAFDSLLKNSARPIHNRATLVASMKDINDAINKAGRKKKSGKPSPKEVIDNLYKGMITYPVTQAEEDKIEYATWEKQVLNFFISAHPMDRYRDEVERWTAIDDVELEDLPKEFYIAGFVASCHETVIKKEGRNKGKSMAFVTIETEFRSYEATLFPGVYESCQQYIKVGNPVVLKGRRDSYRDAVTIQGLYMRNMVNEGIRDCPECHIRLNQDYNHIDLFQLRQMFQEHPGVTQVYLHVQSGREDITILCGMTIALNDRIIDFCNQMGRVAYKPI